MFSSASDWTQDSPETPVLSVSVSWSEVHFPSGQQSTWTERLITNTWHLLGSLRHTGWEARVKINPLSNPKSLKDKLWALLPLINGSRSEQNPVRLRVDVSPGAPAFPPGAAAVYRRAAPLSLCPAPPSPPQTSLCKAPRFMQIFSFNSLADGHIWQVTVSDHSGAFSS